MHRPRAQTTDASPDLHLMKGVGAQTQPRSSAHNKILPMPKYMGLGLHSEILPMPKYTGPGLELKPPCQVIKQYRWPRNSCNREKHPVSMIRAPWIRKDESYMITVPPLSLKSGSMIRKRKLLIQWERYRITV